MGDSATTMLCFLENQSGQEGSNEDRIVFTVETLSGTIPPSEEWSKPVEISREMLCFKAHKELSIPFFQRKEFCNSEICERRLKQKTFFSSFIL